MYSGTVTRVIMKFDLSQIVTAKGRSSRPLSPRTGGNEYVWHCHILEHEEHDMMHALVVTSGGPYRRAVKAPRQPPRGLFRNGIPLVRCHEEVHLRRRPRAAAVRNVPGRLLVGPARARAHGSGRRRKVLYYVDPMHPAYKSDKPGIAPDCGMELEPVYAGRGTSKGNSARGRHMLPGTVTDQPEKQQLIGVKMATVERAPPGTTPSGCRGGSLPTKPASTGSTPPPTAGSRRSCPSNHRQPGTKGRAAGHLLYAGVLLGIKAYLYGLRSLDRFEKSGKETKEQLELTGAKHRQLPERSSQPGNDRAPDGRNHANPEEPGQHRDPGTGSGLHPCPELSPGQRFEKGTELYRIADLRHVWILADIVESEGRYFHPGSDGQNYPLASRQGFQGAHRQCAAPVRSNDPNAQSQARSGQSRLRAAPRHVRRC